VNGRSVISDFMDESAVASLTRDFDVPYDPHLVDRRADVLSALATAAGGSR
jgi:(S)-sulfolactate dehydrogenase